MKTNVLQPLFDIEGKVMRDGDKDVTFRAVAVAALNTPLREDEALSGQAKADLFFLAQKVHNEGEPDLSTEERAQIKERVGRAFQQTIVGPFYAMIENKNLKVVPQQPAL